MGLSQILSVYGVIMKRKILLIICCLSFIVSVFLSGEIAEICRHALKICSVTIIPSLFPFFILSSLINRLGLPLYLGNWLSFCSGRLFGVSGAGVTALVIGLTGGYPMGAAYIADMYRQGQIDINESEKLLGFCNNSGPAFIMGAVGCGVFGSVRTGVILYASHIIAAFFVGIILNEDKKNFSFPEGKKAVNLNTDVSFSLAFTDSVKTAVSSIINVCGYVVCFTVIVRLLSKSTFIQALFCFLSEKSGLSIEFIRTFFGGIIELGTSLGEMSSLSPTPLNFALVSFILGWGGLSVHMQTQAMLSDTEIKGTLHTAGHLLSAVISSVTAYLLFSYLK